MSLLDDALALAVQYPVFPLGRDKTPCIPAPGPDKPHIDLHDLGFGHGFHDASQDPTVIEKLFAYRSAKLIGIPTGAITGIDLLDIDYRNGGGAWEDANKHRIPETRTHRSKSGGRHYIFKHAPGVRNSAGIIAAGIDIRGDGGYLAFPPSAGYSIESDAEIAEWPDWLLADVLARPVAKEYQPSASSEPLSSRRMEAFVQSVLRNVSAARDGQKHFTLRNAALALGGILDQSDLTSADATERLMAALPNTVKDRNSARKTIAWGLEQGRSRPLVFEDRQDFRPKPNGHAPEPPPDINDPDYYSAQEEWAGETTKQPQQEKNRLQLVYFDQIQPNLDAADFVEGLLIEGAMSVVYGESNCGKTFWTSDLALHVAAKSHWCGREIERGGVIYCALEGSHGIFNRVTAWRYHYGIGDNEPLPFAVLPASINLLDPHADVGPLIDLILQAAERMAMPIKLVVVDTLSRALAGGNENAPEDMGALVINTDRIRQATGAHLLFVHHCGKDSARGARGHSSLVAATDTEIEISNDDGNRLARVTKQRELECVGEFSFKLQTVQLGIDRRGKDVTSCIVMHEASDETKRRRPRLSGHTRKAFDILMDLLAASGRSGFDGCPPNAPSVPDEWWRERFYEHALPGANQATKQRAFRRAADALIDLKCVAMAGGRVWAPYEKPDGAPL